jgi:hypothetical protein
MNAPRRNKALTATINRIALRYGGSADHSVEIVAPIGTIVVTTSATIAETIAELKDRAGHVYVAMTNREAIREAQRAADGTEVGVMQPNGDIVRPAAE